MIFKMNCIKIKFSNDAIHFLVGDKVVRSTDCDCKQLQNQDGLSKESFEALLQAIEKEIRFINRGSIFRPILEIDVRFIENFSQLHHQFFNELGLSLKVRKFQIISD